MTYKIHGELNEPSPQQQLWRYMDLPKFLSMIQNCSLFFPSLKQFELTDPWEGFENYVKSAKQVRINSQKYMYVNCWHMNNTDSDSQWKIYGSNDYSLAIMTNFEKLKNSITDERRIYGSNIIYYDPKNFEVPDGNAFFPVIHKRHAFSHEKEFRLIHMNSEFIQKPNEAPAGVNVSVDLNNLIQRVIISPRAPSWFKESIEQLMQKYNLDHTCVKSNLLEHPFA